ncbi:MAG: putative TonB-dependent receptor [Nitrospira sp.]|nr:putative TonB-dependent receptor [Nitrospira sp.]
MLSRLLLLTSLSFFVPIDWARASEQPLSPDQSEEAVPLKTPEILVTATRVPLPGGTLPSPATVLTREFIQRTPYRSGYQVDDLLRSVPDVRPSNLSSRYNHPTAQAVSLGDSAAGVSWYCSMECRSMMALADGSIGGWHPIPYGKLKSSPAEIQACTAPGPWEASFISSLNKPIRESQREQTAVREIYSNAVTARYGTTNTGFLLSARWFHSNGYITVPSYQWGASIGSTIRGMEFLRIFYDKTGSDVRFKLSGGLFHEDRTFGTALSVATRTIGTISAALQGETTRGNHWKTTAFAHLQTFRSFTSQITPSPLLRAGELRDRIQIIPSNDFGGLSQYTMRLDDHTRLVIDAHARAILARSEDHMFSPSGPAGRTLAKGKQVGGGVFCGMDLHHVRTADGHSASPCGLVEQFRRPPRSRERRPDHSARQCPNRAQSQSRHAVSLP